MQTKARASFPPLGDVMEIEAGGEQEPGVLAEPRTTGRSSTSGSVGADRGQ